MNDCTKSIYKDDRHEWLLGSTVGNCRMRVCHNCKKVEVVQLTDSGGQAGEVWKVIAEGQKKDRWG